MGTSSRFARTDLASLKPLRQRSTSRTQGLRDERDKFIAWARRTHAPKTIEEGVGRHLGLSPGRWLLDILSRRLRPLAGAQRGPVAGEGRAPDLQRGARLGRD